MRFELPTGCSPPPHLGLGLCPESMPLERDASDTAKQRSIIDFASLSLVARLLPQDFRESLVVVLLSFSAATLISSCKTSSEFTTL